MATNLDFEKTRIQLYSEAPGGGAYDFVCEARFLDGSGNVVGTYSFYDRAGLQKSAIVRTVIGGSGPEHSIHVVLHVRELDTYLYLLGQNGTGKLLATDDPPASAGELQTRVSLQLTSD